MKKVAFISDFYRAELNGGGESNDSNLIDYYKTISTLECFKSNDVTSEQLSSFDFVVVSNFVLLSEQVKEYLINNKKYIIYEHDHKYVKTRDPSKYIGFLIPKSDLVNVDFYINAHFVVVLSKICKEILKRHIPECNVHNIGCSLWREETLNIIEELSSNTKRGFCIMKSDNPTKNYHNTVRFCLSKEIEPTHIASKSHHEFLELMSRHKTFIFLPTVLETFSRVCVEAKMLGLSTLTSKTNIGFYSEDYSNLRKKDLIDKVREKQKEAYKFFKECI